MCLEGSADLRLTRGGEEERSCELAFSALCELVEFATDDGWYWFSSSSMMFSISELSLMYNWFFKRCSLREVDESAVCECIAWTCRAGSVGLR